MGVVQAIGTDLVGEYCHGLTKKAVQFSIVYKKGITVANGSSRLICYEKTATLAMRAAVAVFRFMAFLSPKFGLYNSNSYPNKLYKQQIAPNPFVFALRRSYL